MGAIGPFVEQEVLKGQEVLDFAEIPPGDGEPAYQVYVITRDKLIWVYSNPEDGFMLYRTYLMRNLLEYEYGKIPAPTPDKIAKRAVLKLKFMGHSEVGIETTTDSPEEAGDRHKTIVYGIDKLERQLRKITKYTKNITYYQDNIMELEHNNNRKGS
jgi:hypothetical protein